MRRHTLLVVTFVAPVLCAGTCKPRPTSEESQAAVIHYDLGTQAQKNNDARAALASFQKALELDPDLDVAHNAMALVLHLYYREHDKAVAHYRRALEINPKFTEARVNLANVSMDMGRHDEAIALYEKALEDMLYRTPYIAENNLGWALYKKGEVDKGIQRIRAALVYNPQFCMGYRNLGIIFTEQKQPGKARDANEKYAKGCPAECDAHYSLARSELALGRRDIARTSLGECVKVGGAGDCATECRKLLDLMK